MDSTDKTVDTNLEDVDTLLTSINGQMASIQLQLTQGTSTNTTAPGSEGPVSALVRGTENTSTSFSVDRLVDESVGMQQGLCHVVVGQEVRE